MILDLTILTAHLNKEKSAVQEEKLMVDRRDAIGVLSGKTVLYMVSRYSDKGFVKEILDQSDGMLFIAESSDEIPKILAISRIDLLIVDFPLEDLQLEDIVNREERQGLKGLRMMALGEVVESHQHFFDEIVPKPIQPKAFYSAIAKVLNARMVSALDLPDTKHIKFREGLMRVGGSTEAYARVLELFSVSQQMVSEEIRFALNGRREGDRHTAECLAHSLKGVSANIAASTVNRLAAELEQLLKRGEHEEAVAVLDKLEQALTETLSQIDTWLELKSTGECVQAVPVWGEADDYAEARKLLERLYHPVSLRQPVKCEQVFKAISERKWPAELEAEVYQLGELTRAYSFAKAEQVLDGLLKKTTGLSAMTENTQ
jgi:HPt (histidine-containing phosphotransfer) domain-containing protein